MVKDQCGRSHSSSCCLSTLLDRKSTAGTQRPITSSRWRQVGQSALRKHCSRPTRARLSPVGLSSEDTVAFVLLRRTGGYVAGVGRSIVAVDWSSQKMTSLVEVDQDKPNNRLNDAKVDPIGRLLAGESDSDSLLSHREVRFAAGSGNKHKTPEKQESQQTTQHSKRTTTMKKSQSGAQTR